MSDFGKPVLAVDAALGGCTAAVLLPGGKSVARSMETNREQAAVLVPMVQETMEEAGMKFADLGLVVTTAGPGSFTGLRIGMSAARAWGLALSVPVQGAGTMEVMARSCAAKESKDYAVLLETKRADYYFQTFDARFAPMSEGRCVSVEEAANTIIAGDYRVCGDALERIQIESGVELKDFCARSLPDPVVLAKTGIEIFTSNNYRAEAPIPLYLRGADVSVSNKKQREIKNKPL